MRNIDKLLVGKLDLSEGMRLQATAKIVGLLAIGLGGAFLFGGIQTLGDSLTPFPVPRDDGILVTDGAYSYTRHPMYTGMLPCVLLRPVRGRGGVGVGEGFIWNLNIFTCNFLARLCVSLSISTVLMSSIIHNY